MVNLKTISFFTRRVTPFFFQQKIVHIHRLMTESHLDSPPAEELYQYYLSDIYPKNIEKWFIRMLPILSNYTGSLLKLTRILPMGKMDPINTIAILATNEFDAKFTAAYIRLVHSFMSLEVIYQKKHYANQKRKERRAIKRGTRRLRLYPLASWQHMVKYRKELISKTQEYMLEYLIENQEEIYPSAILIRNQKLQILRRKRKNNPIWRKFTP